MATIDQGNRVKIHYTGRFEDGEVFDTSDDGDPLEFVVGQGQLIPGFEKAVLGMAEGESKTVTLPPEEAYGERSDERILDVPSSELPEGQAIEIGDVLTVDAYGETFPAIVSEVSDEGITLDLNPPLAGRTLVFELKVVSVDPGE